MGDMALEMEMEHAGEMPMNMHGLSSAQAMHAYDADDDLHVNLPAAKTKSTAALLSSRQDLHPVFRAAPKGMMRTRDQRLIAMRASMLKGVTLHKATEAYIINVLRELGASKGLTEADKTARTYALAKHNLLPEQVTLSFADMLISSMIRPPSAADMDTESDDLESAEGTAGTGSESGAGAGARARARAAAETMGRDIEEGRFTLHSGGHKESGFPGGDGDGARAPKLQSPLLDDFTEMAIRTHIAHVFQLIHAVLTTGNLPPA